MINLLHLLLEHFTHSTVVDMGILMLSTTVAAWYFTAYEPG